MVALRDDVAVGPGDLRPRAGGEGRAGSGQRPGFEKRAAGKGALRSEKQGGAVTRPLNDIKISYLG